MAISAFCNSCNCLCKISICFNRPPHFGILNQTCAYECVFFSYFNSIFSFDKRQGLRTLFGILDIYYCETCPNDCALLGTPAIFNTDIIVDGKKLKNSGSLVMRLQKRVATVLKKNGKKNEGNHSSSLSCVHTIAFRWIDLDAD